MKIILYSQLVNLIFFGNLLEINLIPFLFNFLVLFYFYSVKYTSAQGQNNGEGIDDCIWTPYLILKLFDIAYFMFSLF